MPEPWESDPIVGQAGAQPPTAMAGAQQPWDNDPIVSMDAGGATSPGADQPETPWHSIFTGAGRTEFPDAPELGTSGPDVPAFSDKGLRMAGAYLTSADSEQIADIAVKTLPGARRHNDRFGNAMIQFENKDYYVNKPGISQADLYQLSGQVAAFAPAAKGTALLRRRPPPPFLCALAAPLGAFARDLHCRPTPPLITTVNFGLASPSPRDRIRIRAHERAHINVGGAGSVDSGSEGCGGS